MNDALAGNSNTWRSFSRQQGLDVTLNSRHIEATVGLVNGSDTSTSIPIDADNRKDWYVSGLYTLDESRPSACCWGPA